MFLELSYTFLIAYFKFSIILLVCKILRVEFVGTLKTIFHHSPAEWKQHGQMSQIE